MKGEEGPFPRPQGKPSARESAADRSPTRQNFNRRNSARTRKMKDETGCYNYRYLPSSGEGAAGDTTAPPEWAIKFCKTGYEDNRRLLITNGVMTEEQAPPLEENKLIPQAAHFAEIYPDARSCWDIQRMRTELIVYRTLHGPLDETGQRYYHWYDGRVDWEASTAAK